MLEELLVHLLSLVEQRSQGKGSTEEPLWKVQLEVQLLLKKSSDRRNLWGDRQEEAPPVNASASARDIALPAAPAGASVPHRQTEKMGNTGKCDAGSCRNHRGKLQSSARITRSPSTEMWASRRKDVATVRDLLA